MKKWYQGLGFGENYLGVKYGDQSERKEVKKEGSWDFEEDRFISVIQVFVRQYFSYFFYLFSIKGNSLVVVVDGEVFCGSWLGKCYILLVNNLEQC